MVAGFAPRAPGEVSAGKTSVPHAENTSQTAVQPDDAWRYHFGDDPDGKLGWADPNFDDSSWPVASEGRWPIPAFYSSGFIWVRVRIPVPDGVAGPLAIRDTHISGEAVDGLIAADEVFVNGVPAGGRGSLSPRVKLSIPGRDSVFDLPAGLAVPGKSAVVAFRAWYPPDVCSPGNFGREIFAIDTSHVLHLAAYSDRIAAQLAGGPDLACNLLIGVMALGLLIVWRLTGHRELLLCSLILLSFPVFDALITLSGMGLIAWSWPVDSVVWASARTFAMLVTVEFVWTIHDLPGIPVKRLTQAAMIVRNVADLIVRLATAPSLIVYWSGLARIPASYLLDFLILGANLWAFVFRKRTRMIAATVALIPISSLLERFGVLTGGTVGPFHVDYFNLAHFVAAFALFIMLGERAWLAWRTRDELRVEFETAREMQQQLVAAPTDVPGFRIESAYLPAKQVGGDFFRVISEGGNGALVVVGDVSGKGLGAAMTVSAIIGALRSIPPVSPAWILGALNSGLAGQLHGGFVTCCAARIARDGTITIANAGHLSPYRNGAEMGVEAGLPLGIIAEVEYNESQFMLRPGECLTFLSDGVVEARNASGELFGFERTLGIINSGAASIAQAAKDFGQDDDITVLSITRAAAAI
jgi:phosphoserine phosphatase RsbU/P